MNPTNQSLINRIKEHNDIESLRSAAVKLVELLDLLEEKNNRYSELTMLMFNSFSQCSKIVSKLSDFIVEQGIEMPDSISSLFDKFNEIADALPNDSSTN